MQKKLTGIEEKSSSMFSLFPNPTDNTLTIQLSKQKHQLKIFDVTGKEVLEKTLSKQLREHTINVETLANGIYYCKLIGEEATDTKPFIINH